MEQENLESPNSTHRVYFDLETAHVLYNQLQDLDKSVRLLMTDGEAAGDWARIQREWNRVPLRDFVEERIRNSEVSLDVAFSAIRVCLRDLEAFQIVIENLIGAYNAGSGVVLHVELSGIGEIVRGALELYAGSAGAKGIRIESQNIDGNLMLWVDRSQMLRAIANVISNAVKYTSFSTNRAIRRIVIDCRRHSIHGDCLIEVASYGEVDVREEEIASGALFRYGYRGEAAERMRIPGSGVGLAETKRIVDAHGGEISIKSVDVGKIPGEVFLTVVRMVIPHGRIGNAKRSLAG